MNNFSIESIYNWYRSTLRNPKYRWWLILGSLLYLFSPIDIAPDFLPIVGWIDDGIVLTLLVSEVSQLLVERLKPRNETGSNVNTENNASSPNSATVEVNAVEIN